MTFLNSLHTKPLSGWALTLAMIVSMNLMASCQNGQIAEQEVKVPGISEILEVDEPPKPLNMEEILEAIVFPEEMEATGENGRVILRILVGTDGSYQRHEVMTSTNEAMAQAVEAQITQLKFEPATKDGEAVKFWVNIPFNFVFR